MHDNPDKMHTIKHGAGKRAIAIFGIVQYQSTYGVKLYEIRHLPTNTFINDGYLYLSIARSICKTCVALPCFALKDIDKIREGCPRYAIEYFKYYRFKDIKAAVSLEEFADSEHYRRAIVTENLQNVASGDVGSHEEGIYSSPCSIAWSEDDAGTVPFTVIRTINSGNRR